jgi:hypothetical protein
MPRLLTKHFWDVHIGFLTLFALGSVLEPLAAFAALASIAYLVVGTLIVGNYFLKHGFRAPRHRRLPRER